ncbi:hypothetical protein GYMLUDRAFT_245691 [Collybiopsis luxurians FD-317 M1]|uniref:Uncharacterized protein n=1 Tax=Collybiopsis luxurians FD-317 M1 TaxID=944289 RepID=A0A0D0CT77_9AGAR|nr:hypothetical protein GYMLUDRAFT_245691 [Collybiopsis luxurians FD-317 M1]
MSSSQAFSDQPIASSSASGGLQPQLIIKIPQSLQSASMVPFSNALPSAPPAAKKIYPSISITDCIPPSLPTGLQPIYEDAYLANSSPEVLDRVDVKEWRNIFRNYPSCEYCELHNLHSSCSLRPNSLSCSTCEVNYPSSKKFCSFKSIFHLLQFHILAKLPLIVAYCIVSSRGLFAIWGKEWNALTMGLQKIPYYCNHPEELGLLSDRLRVSEGKRKAVVSLNAFQKSQLLRQEGICLGESSCKQVVPNLYRKGKEVVRDTADVDMEMGTPEELDTMTLDYPKDVPPPPVPVPTPSAPIWKASDNRSYCEDKMIQTAVEHVVMRMASLFAGPGKKMLEQDLWALVDGMIQEAFADLEEQLQHSPSEPPVPFLSKSLLRFVESLTVVNMTSANIVNSQQDKLLQVYWEYQALSQKSDCLETKNLHLKEQVSSQESQLEEKGKELAHLKSFVRHFKGDIQLSEVQQLRGALEAWDGEIEELKKKLAASEEARRVAAEELKSQDDELSQL